jgi:hypothetical protein
MEVVALRKQERTAEFYAEGIKQAQRKSTRAVLEGCAIADQAYRNLTDSEFKKLPGLTDLSAGTLSKLRTIHKQRHRFEERLDDCPSGWTTLYPLAKLTDAQFNQLVTDGKLRPDLTEKTLELLSGHFHSDSASDDGDRGSSVVATIRTTGRMPEEQLTKLQAKIKGVLDPALKGTSARVILPPERKSAFKDKNRTQLAADLEKLLAKQLAPYNAARASLSENEYEVLENAAWQHEQRKKSGKYPYAATDPNSIERSEHPYSIKNSVSPTAQGFGGICGTGRSSRPTSRYPKFLNSGRRSASNSRFDVAIETPGRDTALSYA